MIKSNVSIAQIETNVQSLPTINPTRHPNAVYDLSSTYNSIQHLRKEYNLNRGKAPKFSANVMETARIIVYLSIQEMIKLRDLSPNAYQGIISDPSQSLFVWTNRKQIAEKKQDGSALSTISRHINVLLDAGVIVGKHNARIQSIEEQKANLPKVIDLRGRGNFRLWVNKAIMVEKVALNDLESSKIANFENADNQRFTKEEDTKCEVSTSLTSKKRIKYNNSGKGIALIGDILNNTLSGVDNFSETNKSISNFSPNPNFEQPNENKIPVAGREYFKKIRIDDIVRQKTPKNERGKAAQYLLLQTIGMIYPQMDVFLLQKMQKEADWRMKIFIDKTMMEFNCDERGAFDRISRGIALAKRESISYKEKTGEEWNFLHLLAWLSIDDNTKGTLWYVVKTWVPNERKRLSNAMRANHDRIRWESARVKIDTLVSETIWELQNGLSSAQNVFAKSKSRLKMTLSKLKIPADQHQKYISEFNARLIPAIATAHRDTEVDMIDKYDQALINYRNIVAYKSEKK